MALSSYQGSNSSIDENVSMEHESDSQEHGGWLEEQTGLLDIKDHVCVFCGHSFLSERGLCYHRNKKHPNDVKVENGPYCFDCDIRFSGETALIMHKKKSPRHDGLITSSKVAKIAKLKLDKSLQGPQPIDQRSRKLLQIYNDPIQCEQCGYEVFTKRDYTRHFNKYHPDSTRTVYPDECKAQLCDICGKTFESVAYYTTHRAVEHAPSTFKCPHCDKEFRLRTSLNSHVMSMHDKLRHGCPTCGRTFSTTSNRDRHFTYVHSTVKDVKCDYCEKCFKNTGDQTFHMRHVHFGKPYQRRPGYIPPSKRRRRERKGLDSSLKSELSESILLDKSSNQSILLDKSSNQSILTDKSSRQSILPGKSSNQSILPDKSSNQSILPDKSSRQSILPDKSSRQSILPDVKPERIIVEIPVIPSMKERMKHKNKPIIVIKKEKSVNVVPIKVPQIKKLVRDGNIVVKLGTKIVNIKSESE